MLTSPFSVAVVMLTLSAAPSSSGDAVSRISEDAVKSASADAYTNLLLKAYRKGWRYTPRAIENGFRRHFEELKLQLIDQGYTITPGDTVRNPVGWRPDSSQGALHCIAG
jgi:hypothetical protein